MNSGTPAIFFTLLDHEFFETLDRYQPSKELRSIVEALVGDDWVISSSGFWTHCGVKGQKVRIQGWKIHVSGTKSTALDLLRRLAPIMIEEKVAFKFCSDLQMVRLSTNKNWPRTGSGKFMTIYPRDAGQFSNLLTRCSEATKGAKGPYILTDRPYKDSGVIFYRYGEHAGAPYLNPEGRRMRAILSPRGDRISEERVPYFRLPAWVSDPFGGRLPTSSNGGEVFLKNGRYRVTGAEKYSSIGGIYSAEDTETGRAVIIREVRPLAGDEGQATDPPRMIEKETRILKKLGPTGFAPQFVDSFDECEHIFMVQEKLKAESLWGYATNFYLGSCSKTPAQLFAEVRETIATLVDGLEAIHALGIVLRDLTKSNVLFTPDRQVKFIDFEFAYEMDREDLPVPGWTEGYASPEQLRNIRPAPEEDCYALGALIIDMITFSASGLHLNCTGVLKALRQTLADFGLSSVFADIVEGLTLPDPRERWTLKHVRTALENAKCWDVSRPIDLPPSDTPPLRPEPSDVLKTEISTTIEGISAYLLNRLDYSRDDRLWPASGELFTTNPVGIQFGAAGTAYYLLRTGNAIPEAVIERIIRQADPRHCPSGLYNGLAGVAMFLLDLGRCEAAQETLALSKDRDRILDMPGLYYGAAGWGLVNLHFWLKCGCQEYLDEALEIGRHLLTSARESAAGVCWDSGDTVPLGLGFGPSGIAAFFCFLNAAKPNAAFLEIAYKAMAFEMANVQWVDRRAIWYTHTTAPASSPKSPHMRYGSAGVGTAAIRLYAATGDPRYLKLADVCAYTVSSRFTNKLWQDYGLAGFGELLLDMHRFTADTKYLNAAYYIAEGLLPHRLRKLEGTTFPGAELLRISCDFGMGSAGIGVFLHRLLHPEAGRLMLLDELLAPSFTTRSERPAARAGA